LLLSAISLAAHGSSVVVMKRCCPRDQGFGLSLHVHATCLIFRHQGSRPACQAALTSKGLVHRRCTTQFRSSWHSLFVGRFQESAHSQCLGYCFHVLRGIANFDGSAPDNAFKPGAMCWVTNLEVHCSIMCGFKEYWSCQWLAAI